MEFNEKKLYKGRNKMFFGVCSGIAEYLNVDENMIRICFIILFFLFGPLTLFLYLFLIFVLKENPNKIKNNSFNSSKRNNSFNSSKGNDSFNSSKGNDSFNSSKNTDSFGRPEIARRQRLEKRRIEQKNAKKNMDRKFRDDYPIR